MQRCTTQAGVDFIKKWLDWADDNIRFLSNTRTLWQAPQVPCNMQHTAYIVTLVAAPLCNSASPPTQRWAYTHILHTHRTHAAKLAGACRAARRAQLRGALTAPLRQMGYVDGTYSVVSSECAGFLFLFNPSGRRLQPR